MDEQIFHNGYRRGTFDKCNGREYNDMAEAADGGLIDPDYVLGYMDGYHSNERRI